MEMMIIYINILVVKYQDLGEIKDITHEVEDFFDLWHRRGAETGTFLPGRSGPSLFGRPAATWPIISSETTPNPPKSDDVNSETTAETWGSLLEKQKTQIGGFLEWSNS